MSAAEILHLVIRLGENIHEYLYDMEDEGDEIGRRIRKAHELGYWESDAFGNFTLTAKGEALVAK
jgi:hypothetical protein